MLVTTVSTKDYYGVDVSNLVNVALHQPTSQSSTSKWSSTEDSNGAVNGVKTGGFSFHTELENHPWWMVDLGNVYPIEKIFVFNRDDEFAGRSRNLSIYASVDACHWIPIYQAINEFGGCITGKPLIVSCSSHVAARYLKIEINEKEALHLDQVEVYVRDVVLQFQEIFTSYTLSLNKSGFGDQLIDMKLSAYLAESLNLNFAGFSPENLESCGRVSQSSIIYERLGFTDLAYIPSVDRQRVRVDIQISDSATQESPSNFARTLLYAIEIAMDRYRTADLNSRDWILDLSISPRICDRIIANAPSHQYRKTSAAQKLAETFKVKNSLASSSFSANGDNIKILLHIRLGDTTIVKLPDEKGYMFPYTGAITKSIEEMKAMYASRHFDLDKLFAFAKEVKQNHRVNLCITTDGFDRAKQLLTQKLVTMPELEIETQAIEEIVCQQERSFLEEIEFADSIIYGESDDAFLSTLTTLTDADLVLSTGGHFIYNLLSLFSAEDKQQVLYIRKYGRTTASIGSQKKIHYVEKFADVEDLFQNAIAEIQKF
jgi:hypothetical protein